MFVGVRYVLTKLQAENWKHRSKWTVILLRFVIFVA